MVSYMQVHAQYPEVSDSPRHPFTFKSVTPCIGSFLYNAPLVTIIRIECNVIMSEVDRVVTMPTGCIHTTNK